MIDLQEAEKTSNAIKFYGKKVNYFTLASLKITPLYDNIALSHATGFIVKNDEDHYLVSNWHVFSGRCSICGQPNDRKNGALPNKLSVKFHTNNATKQTSPPAISTVITYDLSKLGQPTWKQHTTGQKIDLACLKLPRPSDDVLIAPLNTGSVPAETDFLIGSDVFIVGYPGHVDTALDLPIWKRGSIATELLPENGKVSEFLVDSATRSGMSGSPVLVKRSEKLRIENGRFFHTPARMMILGVYSGRISTSDPLDAVLGKAWPIGFIDEIIFDGKHGSYEMIDTSNETRRCVCKTQFREATG